MRRRLADENLSNRLGDSSVSGGDSVQLSHIDITIAEAGSLGDREVAAEGSKSSFKERSSLSSKFVKPIATALSIRFKPRYTTASKNTSGFNFSDLPDELKVKIIQLLLLASCTAAYDGYGRWMRPTISILRVNHFFRNEALRLAEFPLHYTGFHLWRYFDYGNSFVAYSQPGSGVPDSRIIAAIIPQWILEVGEWEIPAMIPSHANLHVMYVSPTFKAKAIV
ncbi:MAG: hypothetical protein CL912_31230 [Deltaproteobacteria bacterium]|nr:hypothetical protein [Deltaproteobacteria bacterium]